MLKYTETLTYNFISRKLKLNNYTLSILEVKVDK